MFGQNIYYRDPYLSVYNLNLHTYVKKGSSFVICAVMKIAVAYCVGNVEGDITLLLRFCLRNSQ